MTVPPPMVLVELTFWGSHEPIYWPVERLTEHFGWCPGVEPDARGEWYYEPRWWLLCHMWIDEFGKPAARRIVVVEQALPPSDLVDRPSLAVDPERVRTFAAWLEQQRDWSSHTASSDLSELPAEIRDEIDRFYASPNLWEIPARGALNPSRPQLDHAEDS
jgi:hypothetical protein